MRITEIFMAFPYLLAALTLSAILTPVIGKGIWPPLIAMICLWLDGLRPDHPRRYPFGARARLYHGVARHRGERPADHPQARHPERDLSHHDPGFDEHRRGCDLFRRLELPGDRHRSRLCRLGADDRIRPQLDPFAGDILVDRGLPGHGDDPVHAWVGTWSAMRCETSWIHACAAADNFEKQSRGLFFGVSYLLAALAPPIFKCHFGGWVQAGIIC